MEDLDERPQPGCQDHYTPSSPEICGKENVTKDPSTLGEREKDGAAYADGSHKRTGTENVSDEVLRRPEAGEQQARADGHGQHACEELSHDIDTPRSGNGHSPHAPNGFETGVVDPLACCLHVVAETLRRCGGCISGKTCDEKGCHQNPRQQKRVCREAFS